MNVCETAKLLSNGKLVNMRSNFTGHCAIFFDNYVVITLSNYITNIHISLCTKSIVHPDPKSSYTLIDDTVWKIPSGSKALSLATELLDFKYQEADLDFEIEKQTIPCDITYLITPIVSNTGVPGVLSTKGSLTTPVNTLYFPEIRINLSGGGNLGGGAQVYEDNSYTSDINHIHNTRFQDTKLLDVEDFLKGQINAYGKKSLKLLGLL